MTNITDDTKKLIDYSVLFAKTMFEDKQEFYPFAATINLNHELITTGYFDGDDFPLSEELISKLQQLLNLQLERNERRAYALTYDVRVQKDSESEKTDAIAIKVKHTETKEIKVYYFAYKLSPENTIVHLDSWYETETE